MFVFVAHKKDEDQAHIDGVIARFKRRFTKHPYEFVLGRDDFEQNAKGKGGWNGWTKSISAAPYGTTTPRYPLILATSSTVGKATADIIRHALDAKVRVLVEVAMPGVFEADRHDPDAPDEGNAVEIGLTDFALVKAVEASGSVGENGRPSWVDGWRLVT